MVDLSSDRPRLAFFVNERGTCINDLGDEDWAQSIGYAEASYEVLLKWRGKIPLEYFEVVHPTSGTPFDKLEIVLKQVQQKSKDLLRASQAPSQVQGSQSSASADASPPRKKNKETA